MLKQLGGQMSLSMSRLQDACVRTYIDIHGWHAWPIWWFFVGLAHMVDLPMIGHFAAVVCVCVPPVNENA